MLSTAILSKVKNRQAVNFSATPNTRPYMSNDVIAMLKASYNNAGHKRVRVVCLATDFYLTLLMKDVLSKRAGGEAGYDPISHEQCFIFNDPSFLDWAVTYHKAVDQVLKDSDQFMLTYLCAAVAGELRHAFSKVGSLSKTHAETLRSFAIEGGSTSRRATQYAFLNEIKEETLIPFLTVAIEVFGSYKWGSSYGGARWADIAKAGMYRLTGVLDSISFVDRVYDLKHNGGPIFDKNQAVDNNYVQNLLDAKLSAKSDTDWSPWLKYCSQPVRDCLVKAKKINVWSGLDPDTKDKIPAIYSNNEAQSYDDSPDYGTKSFSKKPVAKQAQLTQQPDYPIVQDVMTCPTGKHHE